jgi:hypothetical protein
MGPDQRLDGFALYNERESSVQSVVEDLTARGLSLHYWTRDAIPGVNWREHEAKKLREARHVLVFLGESGWGETQRQIAQEAMKLGKHMLPVLVGEAPQEAKAWRGLFVDLQYVDLRKPSEGAMAKLEATLRQEPPPTRVEAPNATYDGIIAKIRDGNESERAEILATVRTSKSLNRAALSARLRREIQENYSPAATRSIAGSPRAPGKVGSIRSWMLSCLIWSDNTDSQTAELVQRHVDREYEPDRDVRFWALSQARASGAPWAVDAAKRAESSPEPDVALLARAILQDATVVNALAESLRSGDSEVIWAALRVLRVFPIPDLAPAVCALVGDGRIAYDAIYGLIHPTMARAAATVLTENPGVERTVQNLLEVLKRSDPLAVRNFASVLAALNRVAVSEALRKFEPDFPAIVQSLRVRLRELDFADTEVVLSPGYSSDTIDVRNDHLDIRQDVETLVAVMLAKEVKPPLAIGLFGDWGSGKSFFMRSMQSASKRIAERAKIANRSKFCSSVVSIEFNAWHYVDTNLWASLVNFIIEQLAGSVSPKPTANEQQAALMAELQSAKSVVDQAKGERKRTEEAIEARAKDLQDAQRERETREIKLRELRPEDLQELLKLNPQAAKELEAAFQELGVPTLLRTAGELDKVITESRSIVGRFQALVLSLAHGTNRWLVLALLTVAMVVLPLVAVALKPYLGETITQIGYVVTQIGLFGGSAVAMLAKAAERVSTAVARLERGKHAVDKILADKRRKPDPREKALEEEIARWRAKELEAQSRLSAATARVAELEDRIQIVQRGLTLDHFLDERTKSDDYRRHLGLVSTIRRDFEGLAERLTNPTGDSSLQRVERIVLYIDDLDRCPAKKVMEVLEAVHLLLAYPLFVVVVGVDPRWLMNSLRETYPAFGSNQEEGTGQWNPTPQNYLEKIFQIPYTLRPMTADGYSRLVQYLFAPVVSAAAEAEPTAHELNRTEAGSPSGVPSNVSVSPGERGNSTPEKELPRQAGEPEKPLPPEPTVHEDSLVITLAETTFATQLHGLIPTPRAAKRFANVYRILKASVRREDLAGFQGTEDSPGDFRVPMVLLAVTIGAPEQASKLLPEALRTAREEGESVLEALRRSGLQTLVRAIDEGSFPDAAALYEYWIPRVSRFSFELAAAKGAGQ